MNDTPSAYLSDDAAAIAALNDQLASLKRDAAGRSAAFGRQREESVAAERRGICFGLKKARQES